MTNIARPEILSLETPSWNDTQSPLLSFSKNIYSQAGEDGIIEEICKIIPEIPRIFCEFGAWDGTHLSNCAHLAQNKDWEGLFIEGKPDRYQDLVKTYTNNPKITCLNAWVTSHGPHSLDAILASYMQSRIGILSIDIDGNDYHVWRALHQKPTLVVIEINPTIPNDVIFVQSNNPSINQGSSLRAMQLLGLQKGYELICCTSLNAFFIDSEYFARFNIDNSNLEKLYIPKQNGRIFHGYDGTVFVIGMDRIIWKNKAVSSEDFQVLPDAMRFF